MLSAFEEENYYDTRTYGSEMQERRVEGDSRAARNAFVTAYNNLKQLEDAFEA